MFHASVWSCAHTQKRRVFSVVVRFALVRLSLGASQRLLWVLVFSLWAPKSYSFSPREYQDSSRGPDLPVIPRVLLSVMNPSNLLPTARTCAATYLPLLLLFLFHGYPIRSFSEGWVLSVPSVMRSRLSISLFVGSCSFSAVSPELLWDWLAFRAPSVALVFFVFLLVGGETRSSPPLTLCILFLPRLTTSTAKWC